jgi:ribonuclease HI
MEKVILYTDGGSRGNPGVAGAGAVITDAANTVLKKSSRPLGLMTNNEAEYHAIILGLETLKKMYSKDKLKDLAIENRLDSELVMKQLTHQYQVKEEKLFPLYIKISNLRITDFPNLTFKHIPREQNSAADAMANEAMDQGVTTQAKIFD